MASSIDERIVQMTFNNKEFEKGASETIKTLGRLEKSLKMDQAASGFSRNISRIEGTAARVDLTPISKGIQNIEDRFSTLGIVGMRVLQRLTDAAIDASVRFAKSISVDNIGAGQSKYETQTKAVQTITNATGKSVADVEKVLQRLAKYTDETSYDFSTMVSSIGKFTSVGVDLDLAEKAMEGIANEAAKSGAGIQEANRAMYNFAQALSAGYVKLIDWKSIENANMATKEFKEQLINTAIEMGTLKKSGENVGSIMKQVAKATKTTAAKFKETKVNYKSFNETLSEGWLTSDVLIKTLEKYSDTSTEFGLAAYHAAQEALTFTDAINAVKDAVGSSWMQSFKYMFGDLDEARVLWTKVANSLYDFVAIFSEARNELLEGWHNLGGYNAAVEAASNLWHAFYDTLVLVKSAWETVLPPVTAERLVGWTRKIRDFTRQLNKALGIKEEVEEEVADATASVTASSSLDTKEIQNEINYAKKLNDSIKIGSRGKDVKALQELLQRGGYLVDKYGADGIYGENTKRAVKALQKELGVSVTGAWDKVTKQAAISKKIFVSTFTYAENAGSAIEKSVSSTVSATENLAKGLADISKKHEKLAESYKYEYNYAKKLDNEINYGEQGKQVKMLQDTLNQLGYLLGDNVADGIYGPKTKAAVAELQKDLGLVSTGLWNKDTKDALNSNVTVEVRENEDSDVIEEVQKKLVELGYLSDKSISYGVYGPETKRAIKKLQNDLNVTMTGEWNRETSEAYDKYVDKEFEKRRQYVENATRDYEKQYILTDKLTKKEKERAKAIEAAKNLQYALNKVNTKINTNRFSDINQNLHEGLIGDLHRKYGKDSNELNNAKSEIMELERALKKTGYLASNYLPRGIYGPEVKDAVKKLQKDLGINQTGVFDSATKKAAKAHKEFNYISNSNNSLEAIAPRIELITKGLASIVSIVQKIGGGIAAFFKSLAKLFMPIIDPVTRFFSFVSVMLVNLNNSLTKANIHSFIDGIIKRLGPLGKIISNIGKFFSGFLDGYLRFIASLDGGVKKITKDGKVYVNTAKITFGTFFDYVGRLLVANPITRKIIVAIAYVVKFLSNTLPIAGRIIGTVLGIATKYILSFIKWLGTIKDPISNKIRAIVGAFKENGLYGALEEIFGKSAFSRIKSVLTNITSIIYSFSYNVKNKIREIKDAYAKNGGIKGVIDLIQNDLKRFFKWDNDKNLVDNIIGIFNRIKDGIINKILELKNVIVAYGHKYFGDAFDSFYESLKNNPALSNIVTFFKGLVDFIRRTISDGISGNGVAGGIVKLFKGIINVFKWLFGQVGLILNGSKTVGGALKDAFAFLGGAVKSIANYLRNVDIKTLIAFLIGIKVVYSIYKKLKAPTEALSNILELPGTINDAIQNQFSSKTGKFSSIAKAFRNVGIGLSLVAFSLSGISRLSWSDIFKGFVTITSLISVMVMAIKFLDNSDKKIKGPNKLAGKAMAMIGLGVALSLLVKSFNSLISFDATTLLKGIVSVGLLIAELVIAINFLGDGEASKLFGKAAVLISLGIALKMVVKSIQGLVQMTPTTLLKGIVSVGILISGLVAAINFLKGGEANKLFGKAVVLISLGIALKMVVKSIQGLVQMTPTTLLKGIVSVGLLIAELVIAINFLGDGEASKLFGKAAVLISLGVALKKIVSSALELSTLSPSQAITGILGAISIIAAMTIAIKFMRDERFKSALGKAAVLVSLGFALNKITKSVTEISRQKPSKVITGVTATALLIAAMGIVVKFMGDESFKSGVGKAIVIASLGLALCLITESVISLDKLNPSNAAIGVASVGLLISAMALVFRLISGDEFKKALTKAGLMITIGFTIQMVANALSNAISKIKDVNIDTMKTFLIGFVSVVLIMGTAAVLITSFGSHWEGALSGAVLVIALGAAISLIATVIGDVLVKIKSIDTNVIVTFMSGIAKVAMVLAIITALFGAVSLPVVLQGAVGLLAVLAALGTGIGIIMGIAGTVGAQAISNIGSSLWGFGVNISGFSNDISGVNTGKISAVINCLTQTVFPGLGTMFALYQPSWKTNADNIAHIGGALKLFNNSIALLDNSKFENAETFITNTQNLLTGVENLTGADAFVKILNSITGALEIYKTAITGFSQTTEGENVEFKPVDKSAIEAAFNSIKDAIPIDTINEIASYAENGSKDLTPMSIGIGALGAAIKSYADNISSLKEAPIDEANKVIDGVAGIYDHVKVDNFWNLAGLLASKGSDPIAAFGSNLSLLGTAMTNYAEGISKLTKGAVKRSSNVVTMLADINNRIPASGGFLQVVTGTQSLETFGSNIREIGYAVRDYANAIAEGDFKNSNKALRTVERLAGVLTSLDTSGGLEGFLTGDKSLASLGNGLGELGTTLITFQNNVSGFDYKNVTGALIAIKQIAAAYSSIDETILLYDDYGKGALQHIAEDILVFLSSFTDEQMNVDGIDSFKSIGERIIDKIAEGIQSKKENENNTIGTDINTVLTTALSNLTTEESETYKAFYNAGKYFTEGVAVGAEDKEAKGKISKAAIAVSKELLNSLTGKSGLDEHSPSKKGVTIGEFVGSGIAKGLTSGKNTIVKNSIKMASAIIDSIKSTLKIHSPSKVTEKLGYYTVQGYANGINKGQASASKAATKVTKVVRYALDPNKNNIGTENLGSDVAGRIATDLKDGTKNIKSEGTGLINTVDYFTTELSSIANANYSGTFLYKGDVKKESEDYYDDIYESDNTGAEKVLNNREKINRRFNSNNLLIKNYDLDKAKSDYESGKSVSEIIKDLAKSAKSADTSPVSKNLSKNLNNNLNTNLNTDGLKDQLSDATKDIKLPGDDGSSNSILDGITSAIDGFLDPKNLGPIAGDFEAIFDPNNKDGLFGKIDAFGSFKELFDSIIGKDENGNIKNPFSGFFDEAKGAFAQFIASNDPTGFLSGLGDSFITGFNNFFGIGDQAGKEGEEGAKSVFDTILDGVKTAVTDAAGTITDIFGKSGEESAENPLNGLAGAMQEGITTQANAVDANAAVKDLGTNLATSVPTSIESAAQANDLAGGLESVLKGNFDKVDVNTVTNDLISGINNRLTKDINGTPTLTPIFDMSNFSANAPIIRKSLGIDDMKLEIAATTSAALANGIVIGKIETGLGELKTSFDNYTSAMGKTVGGLSSKIDSLDRDIMNLKIYLDSDALVAGTVDKMNRELGKKKFQASRVGSK